MSNYYIGTPTEGEALYHYGVKGMKWGVRHDPERTGNIRGSSSDRKKMSTAKKVAIGVAAVAAVGAISYVAVTKRNNKLGKLAIERALNNSHINTKYMKVKRGPTRAHMEFKEGSNGLGTKTYAGKITGVYRPKVVGNSDRLTKTGLIANKRDKAVKNMDWATRENARRHYSKNDKDWFFDGERELGKFYRSNRDAYERYEGALARRMEDGKMYYTPRKKINKLRRQKGPKALRSK